MRETSHTAEPPLARDWRRSLLRALAVVLILKLLALAALKLAFFSGPAEPPAPLVERQLELGPPDPSSVPGNAR